MNENRKYTAYCGLYCKDCIPSNSELFTLIDKLADLLDNLGFELMRSLNLYESKNFRIMRPLEYF